MNLGKHIAHCSRRGAAVSKRCAASMPKKNRTVNIHLSPKVNGNRSNYCNKFIHIHTRLLSTNVHSQKSPTQTSVSEEITLEGEEETEEEEEGERGAGGGAWQAQEPSHERLPSATPGGLLGAPSRQPCVMPPDATPGGLLGAPSRRPCVMSRSGVALSLRCCAAGCVDGRAGSENALSAGLLSCER